jgi:hypothetical protein
MMTAKFCIAPPTSSPVARHHGPIFAVMLARLIGYRDPLIRRLRDPSVRKTDTELKYVADVLADPTKDRRRPNQVTDSREKLCRAAYFLEYLHGNGGKVRPEDAELLRKRAGSKMTADDAEVLAAKTCRVDERTIRRSVKYAKALGSGEWWRSAEHLARKGPRKRESLHRTY